MRNIFKRKTIRKGRGHLSPCTNMSCNTCGRWHCPMCGCD